MVREAALLQLPPAAHVMHARRVFMDRASRRMCVVMPIMRGGCAWAVARRRSPDAAELRAFLRACLTGLAHLHARGIVHRDVKPPNILLARRDDWGSATIVDLGNAHVSPSCIAPDTNLSGLHYCTTWFQAPENLSDVREPYLPSGDIWSLATSACCLADGARAQAWCCDRPRRDPPIPRPSQLERFAPVLGRRGVDLLSRMLAPDPRRRISARDALRHAYFA